VLDKILVDGAVESGAELREAFPVEQLIWTEIESRESKGAAATEAAWWTERGSSSAPMVFVAS